MYSLLIKNATLIDGTGKPGAVLDLACEGDEIVNIDRSIEANAKTVIDASGKILSPGFIDIQNHSDSYWQIFDNPKFESLTTQGFTTIMVGNCGASLAPLLSKDALLSIQKWHDLGGINTNWQSFGEFADQLSMRRFGCNVASLVGYSTLRRGLIGDQVRSLEKGELDTLMHALEQCLSDGAFGLSTGLAYSHEIDISELELFELAKIVARHEGLFSVHLRSEGAHVNESVEEALEISRRSNVNLKISHFKVRGASNYPHLPHLLELLETEYHRGTNVHFDVYPYDTMWQVLFSYLPKWALEGGRTAWVKQLQDPVQKNKILAYLANAGDNYKDLIITSTSHKLNIIGKKLSEVAKNLDISTEDALLEMIQKGGSEVMVFDRNLDAAQVSELSAHSLGIIASDGGGFSLPGDRAGDNLGGTNKLVHPRCFGTTAKFIRSALDEGEIPIETAVWKLTGLPAKKIGLKKRGALALGNFADLVIFDPKTITDKATLLNPYQLSAGIEYVFVNGQATIAAQKSIGSLPGVFLRRE